MAETTEIAWADSTFNPWMGCTKVSPACDNCYAEALMDKRMGKVEWGSGKPRVRTSAANWRLPERWNRERWVQCSCGWRGAGIEGGDGCGSCGKHSTTTPTRRRVFCASLADVFDNEVPIKWLVDLLDLIQLTPNLDWLLLTKRIGNWRTRIGECINYLDHHTDCTKPSPTRAMLSAWWHAKQSPPSNVWLGATVVNQAEADRDIPKLLAVPAAVRFLSIEPMLGPVDLSGEWLTAELGTYPFKGLAPEHRTRMVDLLDWVIVGGESGPNARPMHPDWVRSLRDQCAAAGVPLLFKQWGEWAPIHDLRANEEGIANKSWHTFDPDTSVCRVGKQAAGRLLDGIEHNGYPSSN